MWPLGRSDTYAIAGRAWEPWREAGGSRVPRPLAVPMEAIGAVRQGARRTFSGKPQRTLSLLDANSLAAADRCTRTCVQPRVGGLQALRAVRWQGVEQAGAGLWQARAPGSRAAAQVTASAASPRDTDALGFQ